MQGFSPLRARSFSLWSLHVLPMFSSETTTDIHLEHKWMSSKLTLGVNENMNGCLSSYVSPVGLQMCPGCTWIPTLSRLSPKGSRTGWMDMLCAWSTCPLSIFWKDYFPFCWSRYSPAQVGPPRSDPAILFQAESNWAAGWSEPTEHVTVQQSCPGTLPVKHTFEVWAPYFISNIFQRSHGGKLCSSGCCLANQRMRSGGLHTHSPCLRLPTRTRVRFT